MSNRYRYYRSLTKRLGMSQRGAARFLEIGDRTSRRWASGETDVPLAVIMLLEIMIEHEVTPEAARRMARATDRNPAYADQRYLEAED